MKEKIKARLKEPSTWAGLGLLATQAAKLVAPEYAPAIDLLALFLGGGAIVKREGAAQ